MAIARRLSNEEVSKYAFKINSKIDVIGHRMLNLSLHTTSWKFWIIKSYSPLTHCSLELLENGPFSTFYDFPAAFVILTKKIWFNNQIFRVMPYKLFFLRFHAFDQLTHIWISLFSFWFWLSLTHFHFNSRPTSRFVTNWKQRQVFPETTGSFKI